MLKDRSNVGYRLVFFPEEGIDWEPTGPHKNVVLIDEPTGSEAAVNAAGAYIQQEYEKTDWLEADAGYTQFVEQNARVLQMFSDGEISCAAFSVPYGTVVIG